MAGTSRAEARQRRHRRVRLKLSGTTERPRLNVFRSIGEIYAQIVDDSVGRTLVSASSVDRDLRDRVQGMKKAEQAKLVGQTVAERAKSKGIQAVVFDRGGYKFIGRVKALAEAAREAGLQF